MTRLGDGQMAGIDLSELLDRREGVGQSAVAIVDRPSVGGDQSARVSACGLRRYLLGEDRPHGEFCLVDCAGNALPGCLAHHCAQIRIGAQRLDDRFGIGVEVQQPSATCSGRHQVAEIIEHKQAAHMIGCRRQADDAVAPWEP
ncbi:Uncharacterised protein [Mycobacterium tuberculosis]|uniref:Uncharacterized protein n=1 Tax=Mycobacterium tuberculosis TaxID=1773 RepID=A0A0U0SZ15_MYCTX|nr:Uncharacterised protein [Mycobacterium tuberculosis]